jgi:hypothetical protein
MTRFALSLLALAALAAPAQAAPCKADIARFQKLIDGDLKTGFIGKDIYAKANAELAEATKLCKAGQDAAASSAVVSTRVRYGYPAGTNQNLPAPQ